MIKCLKKLCIFFVIGLPILFVNFSSADTVDGMNGLYEFDINSPTQLGNYTYQFDNRGNLATISSSSQGNFVFNAFANGPYILWNSYAWYNGKLYFYSKDSYNGNTRQGYLDKRCIGENLNYCYDGNYVWDTEDVITTIGTISKVIYGARINLNDGPNWGTIAGVNNPLMLCFYDGNYYCVSCVYSSSEICKSGLTGTSLNLNAEDITTLNNITWSESPFIERSVFEPTPLPDYEFNEDDDYTNGQIIQGFEAMGISEEYCYGGFASDNIFNVGDTPDNFVGYQWGSGVNILDIYDSYSGTFSTPKGFLRNFYQAYLDSNYNSFYGTTKSLYGFFDQIEKTDISQVGFNSFMAMITPSNVYEYCYLKFKTNSNDKYNGDNRNAKFAYYSSGTVNLGGQFNFSGNNSLFSGAESGFNNISGFFANMNAIFQGNLGNIEHKKAIIPSYIIVFMLAIILVRILKH